MQLPLGEVPVTEETRLLCEAAGIIPAPNTELAAQSALAIRAEVTTEEGGKPPCHAQEFTPSAPRCQGCVYLPSCWPKDHKYLRALAAGDVERPPAMIPDAHVEAALARVKRLPPPPAPPKRKGPPPAPSKAGRRVKPPPAPRRKG